MAKMKTYVLGAGPGALLFPELGAAEAGAGAELAAAGDAGADDVLLEEASLAAAAGAGEASEFGLAAPLLLDFPS